jgi:hypothetical protein
MTVIIMDGCGLIENVLLDNHSRVDGLRCQDAVGRFFRIFVRRWKAVDKIATFIL